MSTTFKLPLATLLAVNGKYLRDVLMSDGEKVYRYASMSAETAPPIRLTSTHSIADGFHRLAAAQIRGDKEVLCISVDVPHSQRGLTDAGKHERGL